MNFKKYISNLINSSSENINSIILESEIIKKLTEEILVAKNQNQKVLIFGNGGSASMSQHFAAELVVRFKKNRVPIRALALSSDISIITAIGNDYSFNKIFERQLEAYCDKGDLVIAMTTSGNSENILSGLNYASKLTNKIYAFTGKNGLKGDFHEVSVIKCNSDNTARIQEAHLFLIHVICEYIDQQIN